MSTASEEPAGQAAGAPRPPVGRPGDVLELVTTAVVAGGDALAREPGGRVVFVRGAFAGERVTAQLVNEGRDLARARLVEVLEPAVGRRPPPCPEVERGCGGCPWQGQTVSAQRAAKREIVLDALRRLARLTDPPMTDTVRGVSEWSYRTTLRAGVDAAGRAGLHRRDTDEVVALDLCMVAHPSLEALLVESRFPRAEEVVLRVGLASGERSALVAPSAAGATVAPDVQLAGADERRPSAAVHEAVAGRRWRISAGSFFQSGPEAAELLVAAVDDALGDGAGGRLVDAYAGVGLLGGALATRFDQVEAVESAAGAAADARANLRDLPARVVQVEVARWRAGPEPASVVLADPARPGLGRGAVRALAAACAPVFVLVSCDPASLARDVTLLDAAGYHLTRVQVLDLFPHTFHVETVSRFERRER